MLSKWLFRCISVLTDACCWYLNKRKIDQVSNDLLCKIYYWLFRSPSMSNIFLSLEDWRQRKSTIHCFCMKIFFVCFISASSVLNNLYGFSTILIPKKVHLILAKFNFLKYIVLNITKARNLPSKSFLGSRNYSITDQHRVYCKILQSHCSIYYIS